MKKMLDAKSKRSLMFVGAMAFFAILCAIRFFDFEMNAQDTTVFAFSYKYGFISRALLGTIWQFFDKILPIDLMNFESIYTFSKFVTAIFYIVLLLFFYVCLKQCNDNDEKNMKYLASFLSVFSFPMFVTTENFGRTDVYLMILTILCCVLIVKEKCEWLVVPITTICVILHHGFVFLYLNIILVLFFYKILMNEKKRVKYTVLFTAVFLICSAFFLYFEFFSHPQGVGIYEEIVAVSKSLSQDGNSFSESMVNHEILGLDVMEFERDFHRVNVASMPVALVVYLPYFIIGISFLAKLIKGKNTKEKFAYLAVALGAFTILPQVILKVDMGRYFFAGFFYYIAVVMCLIALKDKQVIRQLEISIDGVKKIIPTGSLLIVYPMLFMPFLDVQIGQFIWNVVEKYLIKYFFFI